MEQLHKCADTCATGTQEILKMQQKHVEISRLTYAKNIQRCLSIHGNIVSEDEEENEQSQKFDPTGLAHCITHNTDKVDRRFFGYYNNQKLRLVNKYLFD